MENSLDKHIIHGLILKTSQLAAAHISMKNKWSRMFLLKYYYIVLSLSKILQFCERTV